MKHSTDILIIVFFVLGSIAGVSLDKFASTLEAKKPFQTKCQIIQNDNSHVFDCEVFNDYAVIK